MRPLVHRASSRALLAFVAFTSLTACDGFIPGTGPLPSESLSPAAQAYLDEVLDVMQRNSIRRNALDWARVRATVRASAGSAQTIPDTYPAIREALAQLGDGHSSYRGADGTFLFVPRRTCVSSGAPTPTDLPSDIGYVRVRGFIGTAAQATAYADSLQHVIRSADHDSLRGWIVDLRGNGGGNMWPMLAGVGPVLDTGIVGWFVDPNGTEFPWAYRDGAAWSGSFAVQHATQPYTLRTPQPRVAVLVDNGVASSGEATFIAFRGRPNTRSFGMATCGLSTANSGYQLSDGALLNLTVATMANRDRQPYGGQVPPDELVIGVAAVVERAVAWLREQ